MIRTGRLTAALLLAGFGLVSLPGVVWAENTAWKLRFQDVSTTTTDESAIILGSAHENGGVIILTCAPANTDLLFAVGVQTRGIDFYPDGEVEVSWKIDNGALHDEIWKANRARNGGVLAEGQNALKFMRAVANARNTIMFRNPNGTVVFDVPGSSDRSWDFFFFCGLVE